MSETSTLARPYARAVLDLAREQGDYDGWSQRLSLAAAVASDPTMQTLIEGPRLTEEQKTEVFLRVVEDRFDEAGRNLVRLMAENERLPVLPDVARLYEELRREAQGSVEVRLRSARALEAEEQARIEQALRARLGRDIVLSAETDESLIAGVIVQAGDLVIDGSLRGRLDRLGSRLGR